MPTDMSRNGLLQVSCQPQSGLCFLTMGRTCSCLPHADGCLHTHPRWLPLHPLFADSRNNGDRVAGRGGWVGVRNYELDSGAYYLNLLWNWYLTPGLYRPDRLLEEPLIFDAANLLVDVWWVPASAAGQWTVEPWLL